MPDPIILNPEDFQREINQAMGIDLIISCPIGFAGSKRGPSFFRLKVGQEQVSALANYITNNHAKLCQVVGWNDDGVLRLSVPSMAQASQLKDILVADKTRVLQLAVGSAKPAQKMAPPVAARALASLYPDVSCEFIEQVSCTDFRLVLPSGRKLVDTDTLFTRSDQEIARVFAAAKAEVGPLPVENFTQAWGVPSHRDWLNMPEVAVYYNALKAGFGGTASELTEAWLAAEDARRRFGIVGPNGVATTELFAPHIFKGYSYSQLLVLRQQALRGFGVDFMFDLRRNEILVYPKGMVAELVIRCETDELGPATYWHPIRRNYFALGEQQIGFISRNAPKRPLPKKYQCFQPLRLTYLKTAPSLPNPTAS